MYRALYRLESTSSNVLSFEVDDLFTVIDSKSPDWWLVQNGQGLIGNVPSNYLVPEDVALTEVLKSIDRAIAKIQEQAKLSGGNFTEEQLHSLHKLKNHRKNVVEENRLKQATAVHLRKLKSAEKVSHDPESQGLKARRQAPLPPNSSNTTLVPKNDVLSTNIPVSNESMQVRDTESGLFRPSETISKPIKELSKDRKHGKVKTDELEEQQLLSNPQQLKQAVHDNGEINVTGLGCDLVEQVRRNTLLSHDLSKVAVRTVLAVLANRVPSMSGMVDRIMEDVMSNQDSNLEESSDATRLRAIFDELVAAKDDSQQRSWFLHEDEGKICTHLEELISILDGANPETSRKVLEQDGYSAIQSLAQYYQMETRRSIRLLLLQSFGSMCGLDSRVISELLNSVLPLELARDIQHDQSDEQKLIYSALVLSMIFSTGENLPLQHYVHLNENFVDFLLEHMEMPEQEADNEQMVDGFLRLILAFNLHFELPDENFVMKAFAKRGTAKNFTEKLLLKFNREDDPVRLFEHRTDCPNSVIKFVSDLYSRRDTSSLFYTNDAKVLIDIIVRQLTDLSPGDKMRTEYLSLMHLLLKNSDYAEHKHRHTELQNCFQRISQDDSEAEMDKNIVQQIWKEFPSIFYNAL